MASRSVGEADRDRTRAWLVFVDGPWRGGVVALDRDVVLVGSDASPRAADLRFVRHAARYVVQPVCPDRHVVVNDRPIPAHVGAILEDGDMIACGGCAARFEQPGAPAPIDAERLARLRTICAPRPAPRRARGAAPVVVIMLLSIMGLISAGVRPDSGVAAHASTPIHGATGPVGLDRTFHARLAGSGRVAIPVRGRQLVVRVAVAPASELPGTRFWCLTSDSGLPPDARYCGGAGLADAGAGTNAAARTVDLDPTWPSSARYFIQAYCMTACTWDITVESP